MKTTSIAGLIVLLGAFCFTSTVRADDSSQGTPIIQFQTNFYDFGKLIAPGKVSGVFKFKNAGNGVLELAQPEVSCGCTDAKAVPERLAPGQSGEITYSINLDHMMGLVQKHITVHSNDPKTPDIDLTIQLNYIPLYELDPMVMQTLIPANEDAVHRSFKIVRNDGRPLEIKKLVASQKWVAAALDPSTTPGASSATIDVTVHRPEQPRSLMLANVQVWATNQPDRPVQTLYLSCQVQGQLKATPAQIYWVIPDFGTSISNYPAQSLTRTVKLDSILGNPVKIQHVSSSVKGMSVRAVSTDGGKSFNLVLKFAELPKQFLSGNVTVATLAQGLPALTVPVIVSVPPR